MQELGIQPDVIRAILNHAIPGVGGVYMRAQLESAKTCRARGLGVLKFEKIVRPGNIRRVRSVSAGDKMIGYSQRKSAAATANAPCP